jgi:hypothetical protein
MATVHPIGHGWRRKGSTHAARVKQLEARLQTETDAGKRRAIEAQIAYFSRWPRSYTS